MEKKLHFPYWKLVLIVQAVLFPLPLLIICLSTLLGAPIIPFLGLPIFVLGFPRSSRIWPQSQGMEGNSNERVYYKQLVTTQLTFHPSSPTQIPRIITNLQSLLFSGTLRNALPGSFFIMRFESRLVWMEIAERGGSHCSVVLKGLEMQETTSCHHLEAGRIDEIFEATSQVNINRAVFHSLRPLTHIPIKTHSISKLSMTGVLDNPQNLATFNKNFLTALVYILHFHVRSKYAQKIPKAWHPSGYVTVPLSLVMEFPKEWHNHLNHSTTPNNDPLIAVVLACYAIIEGERSHYNNTKLVSISRITEIFSGKLPISLAKEWLEELPELRDLVIKAYRWAFKITLDEAVLGPVETYDELLDNLKELEQSWHVGLPSEPEWQEKLLNESTTNFISLEIDPSGPNKYCSTKLNLVDNIIHIGSLSTASIRSLWAELNFELLYITNDDDERYSIQAHKTFLRNITIQAAEQPLGYPVFELLSTVTV
jgi:hypothetical protein